MARFNDTGKKNLWRDNVARAGRKSAEHRRCPKCRRGAAIRRDVDSSGVLRTCRYCDYEDYRAYPPMS